MPYLTNITARHSEIYRYFLVRGHADSFQFQLMCEVQMFGAFLVRYMSHVNVYVLCKVREPAMGCFSCCCVADDDDIGRRKKHDDAYVPIPAQGCHFSLSSFHHFLSW